MEPFVLIEKDTVPYFTIPAWNDLLPTLAVGFSTRNGGQSEGDFQSMNLALHVGDRQSDVIANRKKMISLLDFSYDAWTSAEQVHDNHIEVVTVTERGKGRYQQTDTLPKTDGIVTNIPDILLTSFYADCVPLYFLDPKKRVIGLAHAGWKGTVRQIGKKMIEVMNRVFDSHPDDIRTAIGPSIGLCCYEVDRQVIDPLQLSIERIPMGAIQDKGNGHYDLDLKKINRQILIDAGIKANHIELSTWCTSCHPDLFYSHRRDHGKTGRMASWIGLRKDE